MTIIDLSQPIATGMPVYPGTAPPVVENIAVIAGQGYAEKKFVISSHTGTHIDAPSHVIAGGRSLDQFGLDAFHGPACLVEIAGGSGPIELADLRPAEARIANSKFVLLRTGWSRYWGTADYFKNYPVLSRQAAAWLAEFSLKGLGVDLASVDPVGTSLANHRTLLAHNLLIIENLTNLAALPNENFTIICLPLKLEDADGAPVRAAALLS